MQKHSLSKHNVWRDREREHRAPRGSAPTGSAVRDGPARPRRDRMYKCRTGTGRTGPGLLTFQAEKSKKHMRNRGHLLRNMDKSVQKKLNLVTSGELTVHTHRSF